MDHTAQAQNGGIFTSVAARTGGVLGADAAGCTVRPGNPLSAE